mmetsp:Transcript_9848/g.22097  ORF Transcript_9848/g.22097 Transcript_9848/m.22097 type:complete len:247 (-) Transcript_9848:117-857(-)|eukprot:CAMPEP_0204362276 /NCGR_PEP_ID=MMETSP0469-20131031/39470_1 /ASSEMBLY_ACC=CAM_ASM_000384 /TAXON_ID=2969 /ORGANISM="Oxyrrhis marina" /LENGTH=246 /DNA_ID=CAMNT_0051350817 /DNA_START=39 /DNA_END=779 /DNA_ORIENTATION=+
MAPTTDFRSMDSKELSDFDQSVRGGFIRKVFALVSIQLLITTVVAAPFVLHPELAVQNPAIIMISLGLTVVIALMPACGCISTFRKVPTGYLLLLIFTLAEGVLVGCIAAQYEVQSVLLALVATVAITFAVSTFAFITKSDFTGMLPILVGALIGFMVAGFVMGAAGAFFPGLAGSMVQRVYAGVGAVLFSVFLIVDVQMIVGGKSLTKKRKIQFEIDDYVLAALNVYLDIINIFLYLLEAFGDRR